MEVVETHALSPFDHNSKPAFPYTSSALSHPELRSLVTRSPEHSGYSNPHLSEGLGLPVAGGDSECRDIDSMLSVQSQASDSPPPADGVLSSDAGGDVAAPKMERCSSDAAMKVQKVYRGYRTRRMLADSAVVAEELWWQAIDYARLNHSTISFFNFLKPESAASRWNRIRLNASKVGKGLSVDDKAQKLAFQHWIEAIDPRHRYGHSLHLYYDEWCKTDAGQPFFYWLDLGDGREVDLKECPRSNLRQQCIKYLGPQEREHYEYVVVEGKFLHKQTGETLDTTNGPKGGGKWIFVMSTCKRLYAGEKKKGIFHHSSFLAGGVTLAAGRLVVVDGTLESISAYSGHYRPTEDSLDSFLQFLKDKGVNLDLVEIRKPRDYDEYEEEKTTKDVPTSEDTEVPDSDQANHLTEVLKDLSIEVPRSATAINYKRTLSGGLQSPRTEVPKTAILQRMNSKKLASSYQLGNQLSLKWSTGAGPRIGCIADYPIELRLQALELTNLSPRPSPSSLSSSTTPRWNGLPSPSPKPIRLPSLELTNKM